LVADPIGRRLFDQLDPDHEPPLADLGDAGQKRDALREKAAQQLDLRLERLEGVLVLKQLE
jgi:hypothetical protein